MKKSFVFFSVPAFVLFLGVSGCNKADEDHKHADLENQTASCMNCHSETSDVGLQVLMAKAQLEESVHLKGLVSLEGEQEGSDAFYANRGSCKKCHTHSGFVDSATGNLDTSETDTTPSPIGCFTCHAPHSKGNFNLRVTDGTTVELTTTTDGTAKAEYSKENGNICVNCHQARSSYRAMGTSDSAISDFDENGHYGPHHGPQADMLLGTMVGAEYTGKSYGNSAHTGATGATCVACHMATGATSLSPGVGGHSFNTIGHVHGAQKANTAGCSSSSCHSDLSSILVAYDTDGTVDDAIINTASGYLPNTKAYYEREGVTMTSQPYYKVNEALKLLANPDTTTCLGAIQSAFDKVSQATITWDNTGNNCAIEKVILDKGISSTDLTALSMAVWNFKLVVHEDKSFGIHNTKYTLQLLYDSCENLSSTYGLGLSCGTRP